MSVTRMPAKSQMRIAGIIKILPFPVITYSAMAKQHVDEMLVVVITEIMLPSWISRYVSVSPDEAINISGKSWRHNDCGKGKFVYVLD